uniref:Uncharacterized protein n=1 Tax=Tanacetum cinerariifolium TaxID=118510 RepID=A0A6L2LUM6_TANCI|nr:hypothetical protein [Tanacetum cinerariifolium]
MDDPNITMEEYIELEAEKARNFPAIIYKDALAPDHEISFEPTDMSFTNMTPLPLTDQRHLWLRYEGLEYTNADIMDFERRLKRIYDRQVHRIQVLDFDTLTEEMKGALADRLRMEYTDAQGHGENTREIADRGDLSAYWIGISFDGDFLSAFPSYTLIRDRLMRLFHRLIAFSIARRSQPPKKDATAEGVQVDHEGLEEGDHAVLAPVDAAQAPTVVVAAPKTRGMQD